jgi:hypothetical protein
MRIFNPMPHALSASIALTVLAGCAGGTSQMAATPLGQKASARTESVQQRSVRSGRFTTAWEMSRSVVPGATVRTPSFMDRDAVAKPLIFLSDGSTGVVDIYVQAGDNKLVGQVTGLSPSGLATDTARNLYIINSTASVNDVLVYAPPYTGPPTLTLSDSAYFPGDVAVSAMGVVAVMNFCSAASCAPGNVTLYAKNSSTPCATVADATNFAIVEFGAFDEKGNLYIDGQSSSSSPVIGEVKGGCGAKTITALTTANTLNDPGGIHVDKKGRIGIFEGLPPGSGPPVIYSYRHSKMRSLGNPILTSPLPGTHCCDSNDFAFQGSGANVYVADYIDGIASEYAYPSGGSVEKTISVGPSAPFGVAVTPSVVPRGK